MPDSTHSRVRGMRFWKFWNQGLSVLHTNQNKRCKRNEKMHEHNVRSFVFVFRFQMAQVWHIWYPTGKRNAPYWNTDLKIKCIFHRFLHSQVKVTSKIKYQSVSCLNLLCGMDTIQPAEKAAFHYTVTHRSLTWFLTFSMTMCERFCDVCIFERYTCAMTTSNILCDVCGSWIVDDVFNLHRWRQNCMSHPNLTQNRKLWVRAGLVISRTSVF